MKRAYTIVAERDPESQWLVGEIVELPGCYNQAPDLPALEANIREAIRAYLGDAGPNGPVSAGCVARGATTSFDTTVDASWSSPITVRRSWSAPSFGSSCATWAFPWRSTIESSGIDSSLGR
jgi:predicted RNase H-like HicB family nuclease